jgi:hypothetical protein
MLLAILPPTLHATLHGDSRPDLRLALLPALRQAYLPVHVLAHLPALLLAHVSALRFALHGVLVGALQPALPGALLGGLPNTSRGPLRPILPRHSRSDGNSGPQPRMAQSKRVFRRAEILNETVEDFNVID